MNNHTLTVLCTKYDDLDISFVCICALGSKVHSCLVFCLSGYLNECSV